MAGWAWPRQAELKRRCANPAAFAVQRSYVLTRPSGSGRLRLTVHARCRDVAIPRTTPVSVSTSTSWIADRCASAKPRICSGANAMSSVTCRGSEAIAVSIASAPSLKLSGDQESKRSEYSRTASSPRCSTAARIRSTVSRASTEARAAVSAGLPHLATRITSTPMGLEG